MRYFVLTLLIASFAFLGSTRSRADTDVTALSPVQVHTMLTAIDSAKRIVRVGNGSLLLAGSVLSLEATPRGNLLTIIGYPELKAMTSGMILLLAKKGCEPTEKCLVARSVIGHDSEGGLQTESYGTAEEFLINPIQAVLLGSVVFTVDLETGIIRDMRPRHGQAVLSVDEAVAQETLRFRESKS